MPFTRDPLSVAYDDFSGRFLELLREDLYGWHTATVRSPVSDRIDARGLSASERAVTRSLYYTLNSTGMAGPGGGRWVKNEAESLQLRWSDPEYEGGVLARIFRRGQRVRLLWGRMSSGALAANYVPPNGYVFDPAEQSQNLGL